MHSFILFIPLVLSSVALAHLQIGTHPAGHERFGKRSNGRYAPLVGRQRGSTTTAAGDDDNDSGSSGGIIGGLVGSDDASATATTTRGTVLMSSAIPSPSTTRASVIASPSVISSVIASTSLLPSSSAVTSSASASSRVVSSAASSAVLSSTSSSAESSAQPSTSVSPSTSASAPVMTITEDGGSVRVVTKILTAEASASSATESDSAKKSGGDTISTGAIIGISVAAGVVVLALIGCAVWRMKRRGGDDDDAIRWPELNRHGDSDTHHALPARQTGQHGFETGLERSLSNSSSIFAPSGQAPSVHSHGAPMTLNGSNFGATSSLEDYDYNEKQASPLPPLPGHHGVYDEDDYVNMPPAVQMQQVPSLRAYGGYDSEEDNYHRGNSQAYGQDMSMAHGGHPTTYHHGH